MSAVVDCFFSVLLYSSINQPVNAQRTQSQPAIHPGGLDIIVARPACPVHTVKWTCCDQAYEHASSGWRGRRCRKSFLVSFSDRTLEEQLLEEEWGDY